MNQFAAQIVFAIIMSVATLVWMISLRKAARLGQKPTEPADDTHTGWAEPTAVQCSTGEFDSVTGEQSVRAEYDSIARRLGHRLTNVAVPGQFASLFEVTEHQPERLVLQKTGSLVCNQPSGMYFSDLAFDFAPAGEGFTEVKYQIGFGRLRNMLRRSALGVILGLGLPLLLILGSVIWVFVVNNENPAVRWQVFQTLQVVHVLWPPFLIMHLYRSGQRHARTFVSNHLRQLEFTDGTNSDPQDTQHAPVNTPSVGFGLSRSD